jgi:hypothetical protein
MPKWGAIPGAGVTSVRGFGEFHPLLGKAEPEKSVSRGQCNTCKLATTLGLHAQVIAPGGLWSIVALRRRHAGKLHPLAPRVVTRMCRTLPPPGNVLSKSLMSAIVAKRGVATPAA